MTREQAIDYLYSLGMNDKQIKAVCDALKPKWTPRSKRPPAENGFYLCTTQNGEEILEFNFGNPHYGDEPSFVSDFLGRCNPYVVAWMPLPEPYKEENV